MAYVYQAGVFTSIAINIGLADKQLQDQLLLVAGTAASYTKTARNIISTSIDNGSTDANTDATLVLTQSFRNTETSLSGTISPIYTGTLISLNTYFSSIAANNFRDYFDSKTAATTINFIQTSPSSTATGYSSFRDIYRRTYSNELIYKLYDYNPPTLSSTAGTFGFAGSLLEIRKFGYSGAAGTITLSAVRYVDSATETLVVPINSGLATTYYQAALAPGSTTRYIRVNSVSVTGLDSGTGRTFEIWTR
jgi:hypothetical protein